MTKKSNSTHKLIFSGLPENWISISIVTGTTKMAITGMNIRRSLLRTKNFLEASAPGMKYIPLLTNSFSPYHHYRKPYVVMDCAACPRIGILGSLIQDLPDLWYRSFHCRDFIRSWFFDTVESNVIVSINYL